MFATQVYGTILGGFINYAVMTSIVHNNRDLLTDSNGNSSWSGATIQSYNTNATSWALASYLYKAGARYSAVPVGLAVGAGLVLLHRIIVIVSFPTSPTSPLHANGLPQSSSPASKNSPSSTLIYPNLSSMRATSPTTNLKPVYYSHGRSLDFSPSFTSGTTSRASSESIRI